MPEQSAEYHAIGVASEQPAYTIDGEVVYIAYTRRARQQNAAWGYFTSAAYRGIFKTFERSMPLAKFLKTAKKTGLTVRQEIDKQRSN